jgi:hypothetical protein
VRIVAPRIAVLVTKKKSAVGTLLQVCKKIALIPFNATLTIAVESKDDYLHGEKNDLLLWREVRCGLRIVLHMGDLTQMKKIIAIAIAATMLLSTVATAGPKGFSRPGGGYTSGNKMFRSTPSAVPKSNVNPGATQGKTGTIQDLGLNPTAKTPADALKSKAGTPGTGPQAATPTPQPAAPAFGGSGGLFGGSWLSWAFLGYLFGRHQQPTMHQPTGEIELVPDPD